MTTTNTTALSTETSIPAWHEPSWDGPTVERRPVDASTAEWPEGATERVTFTQAAFPDYPYPDELPYTEHFSADGWALHTPDSVKTELDPRMQAELRRWPWTTRPAQWHERCWLSWGSDYYRFLRWNAQAGLFLGVEPILPKPPR
jgi:hypothetical protein